MNARKVFLNLKLIKNEINKTVLLKKYKDVILSFVLENNEQHNKKIYSNARVVKNNPVG